MGRGRSIMNVYQKLAEQEMRELVHSSSYTVLSQMHVSPGSTPSMAQFFAQRSNSKARYVREGGLFQSQIVHVLTISPMRNARS